MSTKLQISIPSPCHENWAAMTPAEKGRFCGVCQKKVHDFTNSSDTEIESILGSENNVCGRARNTQLNRELVVPKEKSIAWMAASAAVVNVLFVGPEAVAQPPVPTIQQTQYSDNELLGEIVIMRPVQTISGTVKDSTGLAIHGVKISVKDTQISTQTDIDGKYSVEATPGDTIEYSFVGMKTVIVKVQDEESICIIMREDESVTIGTFVVIKNRTVFGRILHSIGNLFR